MDTNLLVIKTQLVKLSKRLLKLIHLRILELKDLKLITITQVKQDGKDLTSQLNTTITVLQGQYKQDIQINHSKEQITLILQVTLNQKRRMQEEDMLKVVRTITLTKTLTYSLMLDLFQDSQALTLYSLTMLTTLTQIFKTKKSSQLSQDMDS